MFFKFIHEVDVMANAETNVMAFSLLLFCVTFGFVCTSLTQRYYNQNNYFYKSDEVSRFRQYLQIDTSRHENIAKAVEFLSDLVKDLCLPVSVYEPDGMPIVVITWMGLDPTLPSIMLNSHMDVVPAEEYEWKYPPFEAHIDDNGDIYARGAQDTKDIGMQYLEAVRRLKEDGYRLLRTIHLTYMPDEESGGYKGMKAFVKTEEFRKLNIGFALDEGMASATDTLFVFNEDRRPWQMEFTMYGDGGHGFSMPENSAAEKVARFLEPIMEFRKDNIEKMKSCNPLDFGKYCSVNVNILKAGETVNVIPRNISVSIDLRLSTEVTVSEIDEMIRSWMDEAGEGTQVSYIRREEVSAKTILDDSNLFWLAMKAAINKMGYNTTTLVCPATSDMLNLRNLGYQAVGFAPKFRTTVKIHDKDEYINAETYLHGIDIYYEIIRNLGNVPSWNEVYFK